MTIVAEHKLPRYRIKAKNGGPLSGAAYDVTVYVYPDGHVNLVNLSDENQNYPARDHAEAITAFARMLEIAHNDTRDP